jgi:hypothetical protein
MCAKSILLLGVLVFGVEAQALPGADPRIARESLSPGVKCVELGDAQALAAAVRASGLEPRVFFEQGIVRPWLEGSTYALFFEGRIDASAGGSVWIPLGTGSEPTGKLAFDNMLSRYSVNLDLARGMGREVTDASTQVSNEALAKNWKQHLGVDRLRVLGAELHRDFSELNAAWVDAILEDRTDFVMSQYLGLSTHPSDWEISLALSRKLEFSRQLWKLNRTIAPGLPGAGMSCKRWIGESVQFLLQAARRQSR